ncbi:MAG: ribosome-associated translation inhibitor RaiA [Proteobacteria bacterium]|nr:ribosome-associated translation inhibitor RaiA [Pseudomonadota bacterium]
MDIKISGSNMSVGAALTEYVEEHLIRHVTKYFENAINANVYFSKEKGSFCVKITVNEGVKGGGIDINSDASGSDVYVVFNEAVEKAAKQLRRYKRKLKNHRREEGGIKGMDIGADIFFQDSATMPKNFANNNIKE